MEIVYKSIHEFKKEDLESLFLSVEWSSVEKLPLQNFYSAEEYHQDYLDKNPTGYCHLPESLFEFARKAKDLNSRR